MVGLTLSLLKKEGTMSPRSTRNAGTIEIEPTDALAVVVMTNVVESPAVPTPTQDPESSNNGANSIVADESAIEVLEVGVDALAVIDSSGSDASPISAPGTTADLLSAQLDQLVRSVVVVEELSRRAREAAADDLARYDALLASREQYTRGLDHACTIRDQARKVLDQAFRQDARAAAEPLVAEAERVVQAFAQLASAWQEQATAFLADHPDVELLLAERRASEVAARREQAAAAGMPARCPGR